MSPAMIAAESGPKRFDERSISSLATMPLSAGIGTPGDAVPLACSVTSAERAMGWD